MKEKTYLQQAFTTFLQQQKLEGERLLLMVSGGVDSVVLLHVAAQVVATENLAVFHLNHGTRNNAKSDADFVDRKCAEYKVTFINALLDFVPEKNIEAEWRQARQEAAQEAAQNFAAARILTAHHATDLTETMIFRLTKGAGPDGLSPFDTSTKPFWNVPKQALVEYAQAHKLKWQEDESNLNTNFERNLIRAEVLPVLRKITPNLEAVFVREAKTFAEVSDFLETEMQTQCGDFLKNQSMPLKDFLNLHAALQTQLLRTIATSPTSQSEIEDCLKWLHGEPQGNSKKSIGGRELTIKSGEVIW